LLLRHFVEAGPLDVGVDHGAPNFFQNNLRRPAWRRGPSQGERPRSQIVSRSRPNAMFSSGNRQIRGKTGGPADDRWAGDPNHGPGADSRFFATALAARIQRPGSRDDGATGMISQASILRPVLPTRAGDFAGETIQRKKRRRRAWNAPERLSYSGQVQNRLQERTRRGPQCLLCQCNRISHRGYPCQFERPIRFDCFYSSSAFPFGR